MLGPLLHNPQLSLGNLEARRGLRSSPPPAPEMAIANRPTTRSTAENLNMPDALEKIKNKVFENLRQLQPAPNVQMHHAPADAVMDDDDDEDEPDSRVSRRQADSHVQHGAEYYDGPKGE